MKEATGELNMTAVTLGAIGVLIAFFYLVIWPNLKVGMTLSSACTAAAGKAYTQTLGENGSGGTITCTAASKATGMGASCTYTPANGDNSNPVTRTCD